jgi:hypothetical protein
MEIPVGSEESRTGPCGKVGHLRVGKRSGVSVKKSRICGSTGHFRSYGPNVRKGHREIDGATSTSAVNRSERIGFRRGSGGNGWRIVAAKRPNHKKTPRTGTLGKEEQVVRL